MTESSENKEGLRGRTARSSAYELLAYVASYALRLVTSTVLRRLLYPAAFGIMEIVTGVNVGLVMLSDVGIRQAVIQSPRGDEQAMLDTAWTMQVVRAMGLWLLAVAVAYPASLLTHEPSVMYVLPVASLVTLLQGFASTAELTLRRRMTVGRITALDMSCQLIAAITTLTWAAIDASVWALVVGGLVGGVVRMVVTHRLAASLGYRNRFRWDPAIRADIMEFGKWITGSSAVFFVSMWTDRLLLVSFMGTTTAGIYATAILLSESVSAATERILQGVFYPLFSRISLEGKDRLRVVYYQTRLRFDVLTLGATGGLMMMSQWVVDLLFDERYRDAGWMLRLLAVRAATNTLITPCETCITSQGLSRYGFYQNLLRASCVFIGVPLGYWLGGIEGVVWAATLSGVPSLLLLWRVFHSLGLLRIEREALAFALFGVGAGLGWIALWLLPEAIELRMWLKVLLGRG